VHTARLCSACVPARRSLCVCLSAALWSLGRPPVCRTLPMLGTSRRLAWWIYVLCAETVPSSSLSPRSSCPACSVAPSWATVLRRRGVHLPAAAPVCSPSASRTTRTTLPPRASSRCCTSLDSTRHCTGPSRRRTSTVSSRKQQTTSQRSRTPASPARTPHISDTTSAFASLRRDALSLIRRLQALSASPILRGVQWLPLLPCEARGGRMRQEPALSLCDGACLQRRISCGARLRRSRLRHEGCIPLLPAEPRISCAHSLVFFFLVCVRRCFLRTEYQTKRQNH
jgi:hypothetical protein